jgi:hypothetical protein
VVPPRDSRTVETAMAVDVVLVNSTNQSAFSAADGWNFVTVS